MKSLLSLISLSLAAALPASASMEFLTGHADIAAEFEDGALHLHLHGHEDDHEHAVSSEHDHEHEHGGEYGVLVPLSVQSLSQGLAETGVPTNSPIWTLPFDNPGEDSGIPWLGISTEEGLSASDWLTDLTFTLVGVESPSGAGHFSLSQPDGFGGRDFIFSTADPGADTLSMGAGAGHEHFFWTFSEAGEWEIELTVSGMHATLGTFTSDTEHFVFNVVPEPSSYAFLAGLLAVGFACSRRRQA